MIDNRGGRRLARRGLGEEPRRPAQAPRAIPTRALAGKFGEALRQLGETLQTEPRLKRAINQFARRAAVGVGRLLWRRHRQAGLRDGPRLGRAHHLRPARRRGRPRPPIYPDQRHPGRRPGRPRHPHASRCWHERQRTDALARRWPPIAAAGWSSRGSARPAARITASTASRTRRPARRCSASARQRLTATAEEIEALPARRRRRRPGRARSARRSDQARARSAKAAPTQAGPKLAIREARPRDAEAIAALIVALGYEVTAAEVRARLAVLRRPACTLWSPSRARLAGVLTTAVTAGPAPAEAGRAALDADAAGRRRCARGWPMSEMQIAIVVAILVVVAEPVDHSLGDGQRPEGCWP